MFQNGYFPASRRYLYYGVASASRIDWIIGLFCKWALYKTQHSAKKTYTLIDPTNRGHPIYTTLSAVGVCNGGKWNFSKAS